MLNVREEDIDRISEAVFQVLRGRRPKTIDLPADFPDNEFKQAVGYINRLIEEYSGFADAMTVLSRGDLDFEAPAGRLAVLQSLKNLQANLRHLTWKTQQIAAGDFNHKVDFMGDFSVAFNSMSQQLKDAFERIEAQNKALSEAYEVIKQEKEKSDRLLLNILPVRVADDLKRTGRTTPESFHDVTVFFSDIVGFTNLSAGLAPEVLIDELNELFTAFDEIMARNGCERIKTIGDAYLAVCGMPEHNEHHAANIVQAAVEIVRYLVERNSQASLKWQIRAGIHSGRVVGGVVGVKKYIYDVFGDTINTASRMESCSAPMMVNVSQSTYDLVKDEFSFVAREPVEVKGKGEMRMYFVAGGLEIPMPD